ncbi:hypothetical protein D9M70_625940 [compost metagenome]
MARLGLFGRFEGDCKLAIGRIDGQPFDADRPHRHAALLRVAGAIEGCGDIGAGTPIGGDRQIDLAAFGGNRCALRRDQVFRPDGDEQLTGKPR